MKTLIEILNKVIINNEEYSVVKSFLEWTKREGLKIERIHRVNECSGFMEYKFKRDNKIYIFSPYYVVEEKGTPYLEEVLIK